MVPAVDYTRGTSPSSRRFSSFSKIEKIQHFTAPSRRMPSPPTHSPRPPRPTPVAAATSGHIPSRRQRQCRITRSRTNSKMDEWTRYDHLQIASKRPPSANASEGQSKRHKELTTEQKLAEIRQGSTQKCGSGCNSASTWLWVTTRGQSGDTQANHMYFETATVSDHTPTSQPRSSYRPWSDRK